MRTIKFCSVAFRITSRLPVTNKIHSCVAFRRPSPAINKRRRSVIINNFTVEMSTTLDYSAVVDAKAIYWSTIAIFAPVRGSLSGYCHKVWCGKTRMATQRWNSLRKSLLVLTKCTNVRDGQTDGRTDTSRRHLPRLCIESRGKSEKISTPFRISTGLRWSASCVAAADFLSLGIVDNPNTVVSSLRLMSFSSKETAFVWYSCRYTLSLALLQM